MSVTKPTKVHKTRPESVLNLLPSEYGLPSESWWAVPCTTRAEFAARVMHEQPRMSGSKFARLSSIVRLEAAE